MQGWIAWKTSMTAPKADNKVSNRKSGKRG